ncbi:hypothetical protein HOP52_14360 [Halomonas campisalis]|uniref:Nucleoside-specific outer membrane channel protein Tsx n=1 Tax=Billgrantia campisalis TaxID=74661 RepID=A0ABS9PAZ9_9GAMM|nr:hypothetical protein [Halomonas campisalis]MCG6658940.1 hypothetical protein [Halomonas campisalis]MDR5863661.1 hypothetical protein [Halomonas campisalis]
MTKVKAWKIASLSLASCLVATGVNAATWSDTFIGYRYGTQFKEPGNDKAIDNHILQLSHASGYAYGSNFFNLDYRQSDRNDPIHGSDAGAANMYLVYRHQLHYGKLFGEPLSFGPVRDVALTAGFDLSHKNSSFASRKRQLLLGPTLKFDVPRGFVDLSLLLSREWNHCGLDACGFEGNRNKITFDNYYQISLAWGLPFSAGALPMKFQGFFNYNGEKGKDYFGVETKPERLSRTSLMLDVGQLAWGSPNNLWAGVGYEHWRNKFGNHDKPGVDVDALTFNLEWHF